jgi:hypothetical protein
MAIIRTSRGDIQTLKTRTKNLMSRGLMAEGRISPMRNAEWRLRNGISRKGTQRVNHLFWTGKEFHGYCGLESERLRTRFGLPAKNNVYLWIAMKLLSTLLSLSFAVLGATVAGNALANTGGIVADRSTINSILAGYGPLTENFEAIGLPPGVGQIGPSVLNSTTPFDGFGTGLVVPGVTFTSLGGDLQWNSQGYYGQPSMDINGTGATLEIDFSTPTPAIGVDLLVFAGFGDNANVSVYGADDTTLLATVSGIALSDPSSPVFFGYQDAGGIGKVQIQGVSRGWSPLIDNVTFAPVPEPSVLALAGVALGVFFMKSRSRAESV